MQDYGVNLICVEDGIDSSKEAGKLMISVLSAVAEIERENILVQTMEGRRQKAREGRWNGGFAPYGYTLDAFASSFIKGVLDNPIYMGKMPYGRRSNEKIQGTRNEYHVVKQEEYDLHVTNLNIAQVKRKNGIIERENYNKPKSEDSRQPETTPEKEKAIAEALKYFNMI